MRRARRGATIDQNRTRLTPSDPLDSVISSGITRNNQDSVQAKNFINSVDNDTENSTILLRKRIGMFVL